MMVLIFNTMPLSQNPLVPILSLAVSEMKSTVLASFKDVNHTDLNEF